MSFRIPKISKISSGFTLVELVISFSVIGIISTIGIISFVTYNRDQEFKNSYLDFVSNVQQARSKSVSQVKPSECTIANKTLDGYKVRIISESNYEIFALCQSSEENLKEYSLPNRVNFSSSDIGDVIFFPVLKEEISSQEIDVTMESNSQSIKIIIDKLGGIRVEKI